MPLSQSAASRKDIQTGKSRVSKRGNAITFQHRHYSVLADIIKNMNLAGIYNHETPNGLTNTRKVIALEFASALCDTNPNFDSHRFIKACEA